MVSDWLVGSEKARFRRSGTSIGSLLERKPLRSQLCANLIHVQLAVDAFWVQQPVSDDKHSFGIDRQG